MTFVNLSNTLHECISPKIISKSTHILAPRRSIFHDDAQTAAVAGQLQSWVQKLLINQTWRLPIFRLYRAEMSFLGVPRKINFLGVLNKTGPPAIQRRPCARGAIQMVARCSSDNETSRPLWKLASNGGKDWQLVEGEGREARTIGTVINAGGNYHSRAIQKRNGAKTSL